MSERNERLAVDLLGSPINALSSLRAAHGALLLGRCRANGTLHCLTVQIGPALSSILQDVVAAALLAILLLRHGWITDEAAVVLVVATRRREHELLLLLVVIRVILMERVRHLLLVLDLAILHGLVGHVAGETGGLTRWFANLIVHRLLNRFLLLRT